MDVTLGTWRITVQRIPPTETELQQMYCRAAPHWHQAIRRLGYLDAYGDLFERLRADGFLPPLTLKSRVLDGGVGTASLSLALAWRAGVDFQLDGVDLSPRMLQQAGSVMKEIGLPARLHCRSIEDLRFPDSSFDLVMSAHLLEHLADPLVGLREMARVLRPGGPLLLVVSQPGLYASFLQLRWRYTAFTPARVEQLMQQTGLRQVKVYPFRSGLARRASFAGLGLKATDCLNWMNSKRKKRRDIRSCSMSRRVHLPVVTGL